jgi:hypothetical protein
MTPHPWTAFQMAMQIVPVFDQTGMILAMPRHRPRHQVILLHLPRGV